ncbi:signal peptidase I [Phormidium tenue FACHB-886]|nr:signal peptidase I [Phormidium tenue FACHB-886]
MSHPSDQNFRFKPDNQISSPGSTIPEKGTPLPLPPKSPENPWVEAAKTLGISLLLAFGIRQFVAEPRFIPSSSMEPTLEINDRLIVEKISYLLHPPERGDIVVFSPPATVAAACNSPASVAHEAFIKRVIGLPGDKVEVRQGTVFINNQPLPESYIAELPEAPTKPQIVPPNTYFVMGDNRNNSCDSRFWGTVPHQNIIGRAAFRFFPFDRLGELTP